MIKWTKTTLIKLFKDLSQELGHQITKKEWLASDKTPSDMPIRYNFKNWNNFIIEAGGKVRNQFPSELCQQNRNKAKKGKRSTHWKGGRTIDKYGYVQVWQPDHPNAKGIGYIHEHRLVMSNFLNRPLLKKETVHHKNGIRNDNRIENLELWSSHHPAGQRVEDKIIWAIDFLKSYNYQITPLPIIPKI